MTLAALSGRRAAIVFAASNLLFLFADVALAHSSFRHSRAEFVPLVVSAAGGLLALVCAALPEGRVARAALWLVAAVCIATGIGGLVLHVGADALLRPTLYRLVYSAPVVAPLSYAGLGLLLLAAEHAHGPEQRGRALQVLAGLGFFGNFLLCVLDHAQNGFWAAVEWASVIAGALGGFTLVVAAALPREGREERRFVWGVLLLMAAVGLLGASLHLLADLGPPQRTLLERLQFGPPVFAPLLFVDLAALGAMGLLAKGAGPAQPA